ncbi:hypothetical protein JH146_0679 [Methanocaldococcus bathoardescens]|uniref:Uncharacterized protein n=1 Tax=Methanocaldococcus bathoardescens TaxID=1301915 RepID=A0A076LGG7_9EURY|nr:hypothetical protein [Methanocaldococcus bathoardescens]AIJ05528.1 hypothetical protein JH146_0679 [Methanocaldococcus bathoardescens]
MKFKMPLSTFYKYVLSGFILYPIFALIMGIFVMYMGKFFNVNIQFNVYTIQFYITSFCLGILFGARYSKKKVDTFLKYDNGMYVVVDLEQRMKYVKILMIAIFSISVACAIITSVLLFDKVTMSIIVFSAVYLPASIFGILFGESLVVFYEVNKWKYSQSLD